MSFVSSFLCSRDSHILSSPPPFLSSSPAAWLMRRSRGGTGGRPGDPVTHSPASDRCCGFVIGWRYFYRKERERQVSRWWMESERLSHCCRLTHADPHSSGRFSWWLNLSSQWLCTNLTYCIGVAPDAVFHSCHQGGAADHRERDICCILTFKIIQWKEHTITVFT